MKLHDQPSEVITSTSNQVSNFTIKATTKAFSVLSSSLYSDKIRAIIRELSTNAIDAHVEAGIEDTPFELKLPSIFDLEFYVKDFGSGLTHEQMVGYWTTDEHGNQQYVGGLYNTYFESTKQHSDDFVGMLGLGSKSPFSYVSNFIVESRQDSVKRIYSCFKNELGLPAVTLLTEIETDEPSGLTIKLTVKKQDVDNFVAAAKKVFMYFTTLPNVVGYTDFKPYSIKKQLTGTNWYIREVDSYANMNGPYIVQGLIPYPVDKSFFDDEDDKIWSMLLELPIDIIVPIGEVDISASREHLSYDPITIANVRRILIQVSTEINQSIQSQFDLCQSEWEAGQLHLKLETSSILQFDKIYNKINKVVKFTWDDSPVPKKISIPNNLLKQMDIIEMMLNYNEKLQVNTKLYNHSPHLQIRGELCVIVDEYHYGREHYKKIFKNHVNKTGCKVWLLVIRSLKPKLLIDDNDLTELLNLIGNPEYTRMEPKIRNVRSSGPRSASKQKVDRWVYQYGYGSMQNRNVWNTRTVNIADGGLYVEIKGYKILYNGNQFGVFDKVIRVGEQLGILNANVPIFGFTATEIKKLPKNHTWLNLFDVVIEKVIEDTEISSACVYNDVLSWFRYNSIIPYTIHKSTKPLPEGIFGSWITKIREYKPSKTTESSNYKQVLSLLAKHQLNKLVEMVDNLTKEFDLLHKQYPVLEYLHYMPPSDKELDKLLEYIILVDNNSNNTVK